MSEPIENLIDYIKRIQKICTDEEFAGKDNKSGLFYRGITNKKYSLSPSVFREGKEYDERKIFLNYRDNLPRITTSNFYTERFDIDKNRLEILAEMQHYGIPTRLLDWTLAPLIALYFAVKNNTNAECLQDSIVWVFNPWEYLGVIRPSNASAHFFEMSKLARALLSTYRNFCDIQNILKTLFYGDTSLTPEDLKLPMPLISKYQNSRMIHQSGVFTIHGMCPDAMDTMPSVKPYLKEILISHKSREKILAELKLLFINEYTIYPDHEGMRMQIEQDGSLYHTR